MALTYSYLLPVAGLVTLSGCTQKKVTEKSL